jgi:leader peptidase (prepilin peptidase) / N-methyltransferase
MSVTYCIRLWHKALLLWRDGLNRFEKSAIFLTAVAIVITIFVIAPTGEGILGVGLAIFMLAVAIIDARHFIIPNELNAGAFALGLLYAGMQGPSVETALADAFLRCAVLALAFYLVGLLYRLFRGREGIGLGDIKLAGVAGLWLDWTMLPIAIELAVFAAISFIVLRHIVAGRRFHATAKLPFGLFFAPAIWICWLVQLRLPS